MRFLVRLAQAAVGGAMVVAVLAALVLAVICLTSS
jgi:hypothetical protein